jgi:hypothetical protein
MFVAHNPSEEIIPFPSTIPLIDLIVMKKPFPSITVVLRFNRLNEKTIPI